MFIPKAGTKELHKYGGYVNNDDGSFSIEFNNPFENLNTREAIFNSARRKNIDLYLDYFTIPSKVKL